MHEREAAGRRIERRRRRKGTLQHGETAVRLPPQMAGAISRLLHAIIDGAAEEEPFSRSGARRGERSLLRQIGRRI